MTRNFWIFCFFVLFRAVTAGASEGTHPALACGTWFTEFIDHDKGMVHQVLSHRLPDGRFVSHFRGRRDDLPTRLLDYTISGRWEIVGGCEIVHFENFVINEPDVSPQGGPLKAKDEYEVQVLDAERFVTKSEAGVVFTARRVPKDFKLPDLPVPPPAKQRREPDKTKIEAYFR